MNTLQFVKTSKGYNSQHGGQIFYVFFKGEKSYRTVLFDNMRNFKNWTEVLNKAEVRRLKYHSVSKHPNKNLYTYAIE